MTPKQNELYQWLLARKDNPIAPSFEEIKEAMGLSSKSGAYRLVDVLCQRGLVQRDPRLARSVRAVPQDPFAGVPTDQILAELKRRGVSAI